MEARGGHGSVSTCWAIGSWDGIPAGGPAAVRDAAEEKALEARGGHAAVGTGAGLDNGGIGSCGRASGHAGCG